MTETDETKYWLEIQNVRHCANCMFFDNSRRGKMAFCTYAFKLNIDAKTGTCNTRREFPTIPDEYKDHPERYFDKLGREMNQERIRKLEEKLDETRNIMQRYYASLLEIRIIVRKENKRLNRIPMIRKVLENHPEVIKPKWEREQ